MKHKKKLTAAIVLGIGSIVPTLIGGDPAPKDKYPSTVRIFMSGASCTATLIGPKVLLTAAHCVDDGKTVEFKYNGADVNSKPCSHHPGYASNQTADFALCPLPTALSGIFETINTDHKLISKGDTITLTGYGCIKSDGSGGNDGILREGKAKVTKLPSSKNFDIVATAAKGALCYGDSGGPAFSSSRTLIGVNSRGDIKTTSYLSAVHMADESFIKKWADDLGLKICGLHPGGTCVKKSEPSPLDPSEWDIDKILAMLQKLIDLITQFFGVSK